MGRRASVHHRAARRAGIVALASAALAAGLIPALPSASAEDVPQETVVPAELRSTPLSALLIGTDTQGTDGAGSQGFFHRLEGYRVWTRYADGESVRAPAYVKDLETPFNTGTGGDVLATRYIGGRIDLWNAAEGTSRTLQLPDGLTLKWLHADVVVASHDVTAEDGTTTQVFHLLTQAADGTTRDVVVEGMPSGMVLGGPRGVEGGDVLFTATLDGTARLVAVDRETGRIQEWTQALPAGYTAAKLSPGHIAVYSSGNPKVLVLPRTDLAATPAEVTLDGGSTKPTKDLAVVGDWLIHRSADGTGVLAQPMAGGSSVTLLPASQTGVSVAPDGSALVIGGSDMEHLGIQRIHAGADGKPTVTQVKALPKPPLPIQGLSLEQGRLVVVQPGKYRNRNDYLRNVAVSGTPEFGERSEFTDDEVQIFDCPAQDSGCSQIHGTADGGIAWVERNTSDEDVLRVNGPDRYYYARGVPAGGQITDVSGRYVLHTAAERQTVYLLDDSGAPEATRAPGAAALWADVLWTAGTTPGSVTGFNLTTRAATEPLSTDADCVPEELQAVGRWLYWSCGPDGKAGVYDRTAQKSVPVPSGEAKLGDGFVVTHDKQAGKLTLTTVADGTPASREIGELPDTGVSQRDVRWTVDKAGSNAAWVDGQERVHLVPSGAPTQPLSLLAPADNAPRVDATTIDVTPGRLTTLLLSKPSAGWELTVRERATGKVVDAVEGGAARGELVVGWHGVDRTKPGDAYFPNGAYDWTLSVTPADGTGDPLEVSGSVKLRKGSPVRRDHAGPTTGDVDGVGDLLTLNSSGGLTFQHGDGKGAFSGKTSASGWSTSVTAVPFGDLNKDRCNDVLVRMSDGSLRGYKPKCGQPLTTSTPYTKLGTGWSAYNVLTSPGDLTGDKRADLLARKSSTGDIYVFAAKSDGTLAAGVKIRSAWTTYTKIVGAGDLNGDGFGDVLARRNDGTLYRYDGLGNGKLKDRATVFTGWGGSYNAIVGVGDITGDGKSDLVVRDSSGNLYRNDGKGNGSFSSRTQIATGWQVYKGLF